MCRQLALHIDSNHQRQMHIGRYIEHLGFDLHKTRSASTADEMIKKHCYSLVLAHFDTLGKDTLRLCSDIHLGSVYTVFIALMSEPKIALEEQLFECGANDVVVGRQTGSKVLAKRIKAHLNHSIKPSPTESNVIRLKDTIVDFARNEARCNGTIRRLGGIIPDLLKYFLDNPDRVISRDELLNCHIWSDSICSPAKEGGKTFDMAIVKLRKAIEISHTNPQIILSMRGQGWMLAKGVVG